MSLFWSECCSNEKFLRRRLRCFELHLGFGNSPNIKMSLICILYGKNITCRSWFILPVHCTSYVHALLYITNNSFPPGQNGHHFADAVFICFFVIKRVFFILIKISLKVFHKGPIDNKPALVKIMAWRRSVDKTLFETMMVYLTHAYMCHSASIS